MGLAEWFSTFLDNLVIRDVGSISSRYCSITKRLNSDFWSIDSESRNSLYVGSYGRNTAISGVSDLDIIFELPRSLFNQVDNYSGNGQSALLQLVKSSIERTFSRTSVRADGQVIMVPFTDNITFEVVPVFGNSDGKFIFPDANDGGRWRTTNPRPEIEAIRTRNAQCNGNLVALCRMMRSWKKKWEVPIGGLLIDTLAFQFIESYQFRDKSFLYYDYMCRDFFKWMSEQDANQEFWKAPGSGQFVYGKGLFQYKSKRCCNISLEAINHETATPKQEWAAKQKWRDIFGTEFPV